ncbi:hypothetical protein DL796_08920 [Kangiella spongicola]|uniref:Uncharacterized protein n=1 Tax=Kangiella spongicola TaxID=796379 RepID=A0A318D6Q6_9GAMM|nr:hypothetical protein DL796_08920 [Kangiella spongicola]
MFDYFDQSKSSKYYFAHKRYSDGVCSCNNGGYSSGGGGSAPVWLLFMLLLTFTARRYY